jgi:hypothetical protein
MSTKVNGNDIIIELTNNILEYISVNTLYLKKDKKDLLELNEKQRDGELKKEADEKLKEFAIKTYLSKYVMQLGITFVREERKDDIYFINYLDDNHGNEFDDWLDYYEGEHRKGKDNVPVKINKLLCDYTDYWKYHSFPMIIVYKDGHPFFIKKINGDDFEQIDMAKNYNSIFEGKADKAAIDILHEAFTKRETYSNFKIFFTSNFKDFRAQTFIKFRNDLENDFCNLDNKEELKSFIKLCFLIDIAIGSIVKDFENLIYHHEYYHKIISHGTRAAILSIDVRNMSHNIASHVLAYWIQELNQLQDFNSDNEKLQTAINKSKALFRYIQHRADFLAEVATSIPCSEMTFDLKKDILNPFLKDDDQGNPYNNDTDNTKNGLPSDSNVYVLLRYIAESEGIIISFGFDEQNKLEKMITCNLNGESKPIWVSIPSGIIGKHAIYSILENFIRNAAKHYKVTADFSKDEFKGNGKKAQELCKAINTDEYNLNKESEAPNNSADEEEHFSKCINWLNRILQIKDLYEQIKKKKLNDQELPEKITSLISQISENESNNEKDSKVTDESEEKIKMLNRLMIEQAYSCAPKLEDYIINSDFIKINVSAYNEDFIKIEITDIRKYSCNKDTVKILNNYLEGGFVDKQGSLEPGGWGIKEMLVSANFLRKNTPEDLYDIITKEKPCDPPLLKIICSSNSSATENQISEPDCNNCNHNKKLGIRFYLRCPKHLAVMVDGINDSNIENTVFEIEGITEDEFKDKPIPHNILLVGKDTYKKEYKNNDGPLAPCRVMIYDGMLNDYMKECMRNYDNNEGNDSLINDNYYLCLYKKFIREEIWRCDKPIPKLVNDLENDYKFKKIKGISLIKYKTGANVTMAQENIVFKRHPEVDTCDTDFESAEYFQPISGGVSTKAKFYKNNLLPDKIIDHFYLELIEAALTKVVIVDERISEWAGKRTKYIFGKKKGKTVREMLRKMNVYVPVIKKDNITYEELKSRLSKEALCCKVFCAEEKYNAHFFVIHQGVLDKLEKSKVTELMNNKIKCRWKVIDSGRGVPEKMEHRFVQISALQTLLENYDKHGLVQTLFSLRKPVKEG